MGMVTADRHPYRFPFQKLPIWHVLWRAAARPGTILMTVMDIGDVIGSAQKKDAVPWDITLMTAMTAGDIIRFVQWRAAGRRAITFMTGTDIAVMNIEAGTATVPVRQLPITALIAEDIMGAAGGAEA